MGSCPGSCCIVIPDRTFHNSRISKWFRSVSYWILKRLNCVMFFRFLWKQRKFDTSYRNEGSKIILILYSTVYPKLYFSLFGMILISAWNGEWIIMRLHTRKSICSYLVYRMLNLLTNLDYTRDKSTLKQKNKWNTKKVMWSQHAENTHAVLQRKTSL